MPASNTGKFYHVEPTERGDILIVAQPHRHIEGAYVIRSFMDMTEVEALGLEVVTEAQINVKPHDADWNHRDIIARLTEEDEDGKSVAKAVVAGMLRTYNTLLDALMEPKGNG